RLPPADSGRPDREHRPPDRRRIAGEVAEQHQAAAEQSGIRFTSELPPQPVTIDGDATFLTRALDNLVANALRHTPRGGLVCVSLATRNGEAELRVADTGSGIPPEDQPRIFERFFRADQARSRASGGNGLGLAICKSVVEAHGGTIRFTSEPGVRTEFVVSLPKDL